MDATQATEQATEQATAEPGAAALAEGKRKRKEELRLPCCRCGRAWLLPGQRCGLCGALPCD